MRARTGHLLLALMFTQHRGRHPFLRVVCVAAIRVMAQLMRKNSVGRMPTEQRRVVHFVTEQSFAMVVSAHRGCCIVKIEQHKPTGAFQNPVCLRRNAKQVLAITEVQTKSEHNYVEAAIIERQLLSGSPANVNSSAPCN